MSDETPGGDFQSRIGRAVETATGVLTDPKGFFTDLPREEPLEEPLVFAGLMLIASAVIQALLSLLGLAPGGFFGSLVFVPIAGAIGLLIGAAILFFVSKALGGEASFESSVRIVAWTSAILPVQSVFGALPYLPLLASAYAMYIAIIAVIVVHRVPESRAWTVLGGAGALLLALMLIGTITGRRAAHRLDQWGSQLERSAGELEKAAERLRRDMEEPE